MIHITTSWTGGCDADIRVADILDTHGLKGTFYVPAHSVFLEKRSLSRLSENQMKHISERHEIGSCTLTYRNLLQLSEDDIRYELNESRRWLQSVTDNDAIMFSYPSGIHHPRLARLVEEAGYIGARTQRLFQVDAVQSPYFIPVTLPLHALCAVSPFDIRSVIKRIAFLFSAAKSSAVSVSTAVYPERLLQHFCERAISTGYYFHLWGESWEIDKHDLWNSFGKVCKVLRTLENAIISTNSELVEALFYNSAKK